MCDGFKISLGFAIIVLTNLAFISFRKRKLVDFKSVLVFTYIILVTILKGIGRQFRTRSKRGSEVAQS